ncbi:MAG: hypothetical protein EB023_08245, partial [Flavobacteriia bacterium]|nr:hypothetical protein [Flavobacteriia bacterium]
PEIIEYSNGKVKIKNMYEVNDIQPLFFEYQMLDKEKAKEEKLEEVYQPLFFSVDMDSKKYLSTYVFTNYFLTSSEKQYALKIKVRKNWFRLGIGSKVNIAIESEDSKKIVRTFHCASKQVLDKIRGEVFSLLIYYRVNFTVTY